MYHAQQTYLVCDVWRVGLCLWACCVIRRMKIGSAYTGTIQRKPYRNYTRTMRLSTTFFLLDDALLTLMSSHTSHAPGSTPAATPSSSAQTDDTAQEQPRHPGSESYPDRTHFRENGRDYAFFRGEKNLLPCDEVCPCSPRRVHEYWPYLFIYFFIYYFCFWGLNQAAGRDG